MTETIRVAACDLNGQARGKRLPADYAARLSGGAVRMPFSALNVDISGADIDDSPLVFATGDADGFCLPTDRGPVPMPWLDRASDFYPLALYHDDGMPFAGDPRHALAAVLARYGSRGWSVIAATELEFYLVDPDARPVQPPPLPGRRAPVLGDAILSLQQLDGFEAFFTDLYDGAAAMDIPAQAAISESGTGQFEVNLTHQDAMRTADDTWLFKMLVTGTARKHGMAATFMAKPYAKQAGSGLHAHVSVLDADGRNIFDDSGPDGTELLRRAVAGCLVGMPASTLIFAPHGPSFDRFVGNAHAPTSACWGYENRTAAIRIPGGDPKARRFEHRAAGADTNPYLVLAAVLGAAMNGIEDRLDAPEPITGNAFDQDVPSLAPDWSTAISAFSAPHIQRIFHADLIQNLVLTKRQEIRDFRDLDRAQSHAIYLESV